jgi:thioesterase domain-containing protein
MTTFLYSAQPMQTGPCFWLTVPERPWFGLDEFGCLLARRAGWTRYPIRVRVYGRPKAGQRPPPSPANKLIGEYLAAIASVQMTGKLLLGGKSMGGRMASMIAEKLYRDGKAAGLICLGYPFHPPGSPESCAPIIWSRSPFPRLSARESETHSVRVKRWKLILCPNRSNCSGCPMAIMT